MDKYLFFKLGEEVKLGLLPCLISQRPPESVERAIASPITVRSAESNDIKALANLLTLSFHPPQVTLAAFYPLLKLGIYEDLRSRLRVPSAYYRCLVASCSVAGAPSGSEKVVGTAEIALRAPWFGVARSPYISNFAVSPNYRRQGVGRHLLQRCEQIAREWQCANLSLHVLEDNQPAKALYFAKGYQLTRVEPSWRHWLFQHPRRLYLQKNLS